MISEFLDIEQGLKRRFREDSVTDILVASLLLLPGNDVVILTPPEAKTGGDFDLVIVEPNTGDAVQFRIQAKRLSPHKYDWPMGSYVELAHPKNEGTQSRKLVSGIGREAYPTIPLYAFYHPAHVCAASGNVISGIELASGWEVRERIKAIVKAKPKRLPYKRIGSLQPLFFPLSTILCSPINSTSRSTLPLPSEVRTAVMDAIEERASLAGFGQTLQIPEYVIQRLERSSKSNSAFRRSKSRTSPDKLPAVIRMAIARRQERIISARVKRPRIILISDQHPE